MELVPQLLGLQAAGDLGHLLAGDARVGGDERLGAQGGRAPTEVCVSVQRGQVGQRRLAAGRLLHEFFFQTRRDKQEE